MRKLAPLLKTPPRVPKTNDILDPDPYFTKLCWDDWKTYFGQRSPNGQAVVWRLPGLLAGGRRPGYPSKRPTVRETEAWIMHVREMGVRSLFCLLEGRDLHDYYGHHRIGLLERHRRRGLSAEHIPAPDHCEPPVTSAHMEELRRVLGKLPKPWVIHCSAGLGRSWLAVQLLATWPCIQKHCPAAMAARPTPMRTNLAIR